MSVVDVADLLEELVNIDSRNPTLSPDSAGEGPLAGFVADYLASHGIMATLHEVAPGRPNLLARLEGAPGAPTILLEAHLDTVPTPLGGIPVRRDGGRIYGRGACDTKGSLASMMAAMIELAADETPHATIVLAGAVDEEATMLGAAALLDELPVVLGAVIGEPTSLQVVRAHNGFIRVILQATGISAHSSKAHLGSNAVLDASRAVVALADSIGERLADRSHELIGPALLTSTMMNGGVAPNVVPDACSVTLDRRVSPDESIETALAEIRDCVDAVETEGALHLDPPSIALPGVNTPADHPLVALLNQAVAVVLGTRDDPIGVTYSTDACRLDPGGIGCVVFGPGSIDQAHTDNEWVDLVEVEHATRVFVELAQLGASL